MGFDTRAVLSVPADGGVRYVSINRDDWRDLDLRALKAVLPKPDVTNCDHAIRVQSGWQEERDFRVHKEATVVTPIRDGELPVLKVRRVGDSLEIVAAAEKPDLTVPMAPLSRHEKIRLAWKKVGNKFALTVLLQKRCQELVRGSARLVDTDSKSPIEIALEEVIAGKIWLGDRPAGLPAPVPMATAASRAEAAAAASRKEGA